jgi:hypothetical protein
MLAAAGCGGGGRASAPTTTNPEQSFVRQVDVQGLRHGLSDDEIIRLAHDFCRAASHRPGQESRVAIASLALQRYLTPNGAGATGPDGKAFALLAGRVLCPQCNQAMSAGNDLI